MAYVLGFFAADGNLTLGKRGNHYIEFTSCDKKIIEKIKNFLESNNKISSKKRKDKWKECFRIQIGSKIMFYDLIKLGFIPNKSKKLTFPLIPDYYLSDFVRGYFDGDGHVMTGVYSRKNRKSKNKILFSGFTSGTRRFLHKLWASLKKKGIVVGGTLYYHQGYRLNFSKNDSLSLYNFLYKDIRNDLYLARKRSIFELFISENNGPVV